MSIQLSLCIATFKRAAYIVETLDSIVPQLCEGIEVVIVDGASPDDTPAAVAPYLERYPQFRYFREGENSGVDADYDKAVGYARGQHCWLLPDDDLLAPGAILRVLEALEGGKVDLLIVDSEVRDRKLQQVLRASRLGFSGERRYGPDDSDAFLRDAGYCLTYIGGVIIRREVWIARERKPYFGSMFIHVGVIFQSPAINFAKIMAEPLIRLRAGNSMWQPHSFEIWAFLWPELIWGFANYSSDAKSAVTPREPWRRFWWLLGYRALGAYSTTEYGKYLDNRLSGRGTLPRLAAALPGRWANTLAVGALILSGKGGGAVAYDLVVSSRYSNSVSRLLTRPWFGRLDQRPR